MHPRSERPSLLKTAVTRYTEALDEDALAYLAARGIDPNVAATFRLGLVVEPAVGHDMFSGRLSIPYMTRAGVRTVKFRCLEDHDCAAEKCPKYLGLPGARPYMFNPGALLEGDVVAVCEGELDAVVCSGVVGILACGVPGVSSWKEHFPRMFAGIPRVIVIRDHDVKQEGRDPGKELSERIAKAIDRAVVVTPPAGMDLTDWVLSEGPDKVRRSCGL